MPYIKQENREKFDIILSNIPFDTFTTKGELEYCVFKLMTKYMSYKEFRYSILHDITYAIMHCADEFRRRFLDKREEMAITENGDIH